jgi:hypothetical protein
MVNCMGWACSAYGGKERRIQGFGGENLRDKRPLGRPRHRWEDNIKMEWGVFVYNIYNNEAMPITLLVATYYR